MKAPSLSEWDTLIIHGSLVQYALMAPKELLHSLRVLTDLAYNASIQKKKYQYQKIILVGLQLIWNISVHFAVIMCMKYLCFIHGTNSWWYDTIVVWNCYSFSYFLKFISCKIQVVNLLKSYWFFSSAS